MTRYDDGYTLKALTGYIGDLNPSKYSDTFESVFIDGNSPATESDKEVGKLSFNPLGSQFYRLNNSNWIVLKNGTDERWFL